MVVFDCILVGVILADEVLRILKSVTWCSKLVKTTRNELGTVPKTSRKLKQTMLDLYPDDFSCRLFRTGQDFCLLDLDSPTIYIKKKHKIFQNLEILYI